MSIFGPNGKGRRRRLGFRTALLTSRIALLTSSALLEVRRGETCWFTLMVALTPFCPVAVTWLRALGCLPGQGVFPDLQQQLWMCVSCPLTGSGAMRDLGESEVHPGFLGFTLLGIHTISVHTHTSPPIHTADFTSSWSWDGIWACLMFSFSLSTPREERKLSIGMAVLEGREDPSSCVARRSSHEIFSDPRIFLSRPLLDGMDTGPVTESGCRRSHFGWKSPKLLSSVDPWAWWGRRRGSQWKVRG